MKKLALIFGAIGSVLLTVGVVLCLRGFMFNYWNPALLLPTLIIGLITLGMSIAFVIAIKEEKK